MRRAALLGILVLCAAGTVASEWWRGEVFVAPSLLGIFVCAIACVCGLIAGAMQLRRAQLGHTSPALLLLPGLLPSLCAAVLANFELNELVGDRRSSELGPVLVARYGLLAAAELRGYAGALSALLLSILSMGVALSSSGDRRRGFVAGLLCAAPFAVVFIVFPWNGTAKETLAQLPMALPSVVALGALPLVMSGGHSLSRGLTIALALMLAQVCGTMVASAALVDCMFGFHGATPASELEIAQSCATTLFPSRWFESYPWACGAASAMLVVVMAARVPFAKTPLTTGLAIVVAFLSFDALVMTRLIHRAEGEAGELEAVTATEPTREPSTWGPRFAHRISFPD